MTEAALPERPWKRVAGMALWLCLAPPVGLWKLYHDEALSASAKWRILIYLFVIPGLLYVTFSLWMTSTALQRALP